MANIKGNVRISCSLIQCPFCVAPQRAVGKAEDLVKAHQEYQQDLHAFEEWLEQEQEKLGCYTQLEGDVDMLEDTIQKLQVVVFSLLYCQRPCHSVAALSCSKKMNIRESLHLVSDKAQLCFVLTGAAAVLHRGPSSAEHPAAEQRAGHSLGSAPDRGESAGNPSAGVEALPVPAGRFPRSAQQRFGQTSTDGAEVPSSRQLAERHGDQSPTAF